MPSKSLAALPSTPSPTALFAQTERPQQILTPLLSFISALLSRSASDLPHSFLPRANSRTGAQTARSFALFHSLSKGRKSSRVFPTACALFTENAGMYSPSHFQLSIFHFPSSNFFRINTYRIAICKPFRMNTYGKRGVGVV